MAVLFILSAALAPQSARGGCRVEYVSPIPGSRRVSPLNNIILRYAAPLDANSIQGRISLQVIGTKSGAHSGRLILLDDNKTLIFTPDSEFALDEQVMVRATPDLRTVSGASAATLDFSFETSPVDPKQQGAQLSNRESACALEPYFEANIALNNEEYLKATGMEPAVTNGSLPADLPAISLLLANAPDPGNVFLSPFTLPSLFGHLVIVDNLGIPVFYRRIDRYAYDFKMQPNGLLTHAQWGLFFFALDSNYTVVDSFRAGNGYTLTDLHDLLLLDNGNALLMVKDPQPVNMASVVVGGNANASVTGLIIQELDPNKNVVFQWRSWDHFEISDGSVSNYVSLTDSLIDYVHGNALEVDWDGNILLSSRHMNEITKIDRQTGAILWRFAPNGVNNQFTMVNDPRGFSHQHDIRRLANGNITLFDNGNFLAPEYTRVVEYQLDEVNKVATLVSEYRNTPDVYSPAMGSAQRRSSGGTMIGWGMNVTAPHVTDIHADGTKAFELGLDTGYFSYRAFRFPWRTTRFAASVDTLDFGHLLLNESATRSVFVRNTSTSDVTITSLVTSDPDFWSSTAVPFTIVPGDSAEVSIHFDPAWITEAVAHLYVRAETATELVAQTVVLTGAAGAITAVPELSEIPSQYRLHTSSPNPFNPTTSIRYDVPRRAHVRLAIFDARGRQVATLVDGMQQPGEHEVRWHAPDIASGIYICRMTAGQFVATRKLTVLR